MKKEDIFKWLKKEGYKMTPQRRFIIEEMFDNTLSHPTVESVYKKVKKKLPEISLATVYQTLELLSEGGFLKKLQFGTTKSHFDSNPKSHVHFYCKICGKIKDGLIPLKSIKGVSFPDKFVPEDFFLVYEGICGKCQKRKKT